MADVALVFTVAVVAAAVVIAGFYDAGRPR